MTPRPDLDALLGNAGWARALARSLVRDASTADDLVQRASIAAWRHRAEGDAPPRRWLAAVMRNLVRQDKREAQRRVLRERIAARPEAFHAATAGDDLDESLSLQRKLLELVQGLPDEQRKTIWSRYYEGLPPREIARRDGVPVSTVKKRLALALEKLRARLDLEHDGDRRVWLAMLVPLTKPPSLAGAVTPVLGALLVNTQLKIACALVAVLGAIAVWKVSSSSEPLEPQSAGNVERTSPALAAESKLSEPAAPIDPARAAIKEEAKRPAPAVAAAVEPRVVHGRVLDLERRPIGGIDIIEPKDTKSSDSISKATPLTSSRDDGTFEVPDLSTARECVARDPSWVTVFSAFVWKLDTAQVATIWVARRRSLAGVVVDPARHAIAHARVQIVLDRDLRRALGSVLDTAILQRWEATTDEQGRFELKDAPLATGELSVDAIGWKPKSMATPAQPAYDLEIALEPLEKLPAILRGHVVDAEKRPVEGAHVALGSTTHLTRADGAFEFDVDAVSERTALVFNADGVADKEFDLHSVVAVKAGTLPARATVPSREEMRAASEPTEVLLILDKAMLEIRGRVIDADGHPVSHVHLQTEAETMFGMIDDLYGNEGTSMKVTVEEMLRGGITALKVLSAADGSFVIGGLLDRVYTLNALDERTLRRARVEDVRAGRGEVVIRLPSEKECARVAGRVVSLAGDPIADAMVGVGCATGAELYSGGVTFGPHTTTDEKGRFEFPKLVSSGLTFQITSSTTFLVLAWNPGPKDVLDDLTIRVSRLCHVQVDLGERKDLADRFTVLDATDTPVQMRAVHGNVSWFPTQVDIAAGRSEAIACEESGRTVVLYKVNVEVTRMPIALRPGELVTVRP